MKRVILDTFSSHAQRKPDVTNATLNDRSLRHALRPAFDGEHRFELA